MICEVKTINTSEDETAARRNPRFAGTGLVRLPKEFFEKLKNTLVTAGRQMTCYCLSPETNRIVYVIVNYDDPLHECEREYRAQIDAFMASKPVPGLDVEFDIKPALYYLA